MRYLFEKQRGFTLMEVVLAVLVIAILSTGAVVFVGSGADAAKYEETWTKMRAIRNAIFGDSAVDSFGYRTNFGYTGDMGRLPGTLVALTSTESPAWYYDATLQMGVGWRGPYMTTQFGNSVAVDKDAWGRSFVYTTSGALTSYGADGASGGSVFNKDITMNWDDKEWKASSVFGVVSDGDMRLDNKTVTLYYPSAGAMTSANATTNAPDGDFTFSAIPYGIRALKLTGTPSLGPKRVVVQSDKQQVSGSTMDLAGSSAVTCGSPTISSGTDTVQCTLTSTYNTDLTLKYITVTTSSTAFLNRVKTKATGAAETQNLPNTASGTRVAIDPSLGTPLTVTANSSTEVLELYFKGNAAGTAMADIGTTYMAIVLEWEGISKRDVITFTTPVGDTSTFGTLDTSFYTIGKRVVHVTSTFDNGTMIAHNLVTDTLTVAGYVAASVPVDWFVMRFRSDGNLDTSFSTDGMRTQSFGAGDEYARGLVLTTDGKTRVAGYEGLDFAHALYLSDGSLDTSFHTDGLLDSAAGGTDYGSVIALQTDGLFMQALGWTVSTLDFGVARFRSDGSYDTSFHTDGRHTIDISGASDFAQGILILTDGKIVTAGSAGTDTASPAAGLVRWHTDGQLDTTFQTVGYKQYTNVSKVHNALAVDSSQRLYIAGYTGSADWRVGRLLSNGSLDTSFATTGFYAIDWGSTDHAYGILLQSDGKSIVVGGRGLACVFCGATYYAILRLTTGGQLDTSFSTDGKITDTFAAGNANIISIVDRGSNRFCVTGVGNANADLGIACYRY